MTLGISEDVVAVASEYRFNGLRGQGQLLFTDKDGDAVILGGPDRDGDLDIIRKDRDIMVLTNFFPHHPDMGGFPCLRFQSATHHLFREPREGEGLDEINKLRKAGRISRRIPRFVAYH
ncbi:MAG: hypothetical protein WBB73_15835 [Candidatus Aminicenantaceae bacterium]